MAGTNAIIRMLYFAVLMFTFYKMYSCHNMQGKGTCTRAVNQEQHVELIFCCRNFEYIDGKCQECKQGFTTDGDKPCTKCENGLFGEKCADKCNCKAREICDNVKGCVQFNQSLNGLDTEPTTQTVFKDKSKGLDAEPTTQIVFKDKSSDTELKIADCNDKNQALHYVYGTIIGILLVINILSLACIVVFKRLKESRITEFLGTMSQAEEYNYIDENMLDNVEPQSVNNAMVSTNVSAVSDENELHLTTIERTSSSVDDDGYLIPRHPASVNISIHNDVCSNDVGISKITNNNDNANRYQQLTRPYEPIWSLYDITQHEYLLQTNDPSNVVCQMNNTDTSFIEIDGIRLD